MKLTDRFCRIPIIVLVLLASFRTEAQTPQSNRGESSSLRQTKPTTADKDLIDWNKARKSATQEAYLEYADAHPNTKRLRIIEGPVLVSGRVVGNVVSQVLVTIGDNPGIKVELDGLIARKLGLLTYKPPEAPAGFERVEQNGNYTESRPNARVLLTLDRSSPEILAVETLKSSSPLPPVSTEIFDQTTAPHHASAIDAIQDNGDGTVTDKKMDLVWAKYRAKGYMAWPNARKFCQDLSLAGHSDWTLPSRAQLISFWNDGGFHTAADDGDWSSEIDSTKPNDSADFGPLVWVVNSKDGSLADGPASGNNTKYLNSVRCVRGGI